MLAYYLSSELLGKLEMSRLFILPLERIWKHI